MADLSNREELQELLQRHGLWARKGLSQHFLCSSSVADKIGEAVSGCEGALEIGPGPGVLTQRLCGLCKRVIAVELDAAMLPALAETAECAEVRVGDALKSDWPGLLERLPSPRALVSNMPYQITGPLLTLAGANRRHFERAVLMMQKEVATRALARPGTSERGSLSVFLQARFSIRKIADAPRGAFAPAPKVDSVVLEFTPIETGLLETEEVQFDRFVRGAFRMPRKTLANNLFGLAGSRERAINWLLAGSIDERARPSVPDIEQWIALWRRSKSN